MNTVYKYRNTQGVAEYEILNGEFGVDDTLHLRDTSCQHSGDKCEIEVVKCESGDCYQFAKALNSNAEKYIHFHQLEKFWATKEEAYVEGMEKAVEIYYRSIAENEKSIVEAEEKLKSMKKEVIKYFTKEMVKSECQCYVENEGTCRIIGIILFDDGRIGYLTDSNYSDVYVDYEGDRIILVENKATCRLMTENESSVYASKQDYDNIKANKAMENLEKNIESSRNDIERYTLIIEELNSIIGQKDSLTFEQMKNIRNGN